VKEFERGVIESADDHGTGLYSLGELWKIDPRPLHGFLEGLVEELLARVAKEPLAQPLLNEGGLPVCVVDDNEPVAGVVAGVEKFRNDVRIDECCFSLAERASHQRLDA
jgi:hypothetical protein